MRSSWTVRKTKQEWNVKKSRKKCFKKDLVNCVRQATEKSGKLRTKGIIGFRQPSHYILREHTEPRVGVGWELFAVKKGDSKDNKSEKCDHKGKERGSAVAQLG